LLGELDSTNASVEYIKSHFKTAQSYFGFTFEKQLVIKLSTELFGVFNFGFTFEKQLELFAMPRHFEKLANLRTFRFERNGMFTTYSEKALVGFE